MSDRNDTEHLLSSPANAERLREAIREMDRFERLVDIIQEGQNELANPWEVAGRVDALYRQHGSPDLRDALRECADDLECELNARYGDPIHPSQQRRYDRDMLVVRRARALLGPILEHTDRCARRATGAMEWVCAPDCPVVFGAELASGIMSFHGSDGESLRAGLRGIGNLIRRRRRKNP